MRDVSCLFIIVFFKFQIMTFPFNKDLFTAIQPSIDSGWAFLIIAVPLHIDGEIQYPYYTGDLSKTIDLLAKGYRNPGENILPMRYVTMPPEGFIRLCCILFKRELISKLAALIRKLLSFFKCLYFLPINALKII